MSEWISAEDRLPEKEGYYLTLIKDSVAYCPHEIQYFSKETRLVEGMYASDWTHWSKIEWVGDKVSHWMPLPPPPSL